MHLNQVKRTSVLMVFALLGVAAIVLAQPASGQLQRRVGELEDKIATLKSKSDD